MKRRVLLDAFAARHGRPPLDEIELKQYTGESVAKNRDAVAGYDLVFTPVKSVTTLWGIASHEVRQQIFDAHNDAVSDAIDWLEVNAAFTRTGDVGQAQIDTGGVIAARFVHFDSRAGDPDLHTQVAISNKVQGDDGKWRSLDGRAMFAAAVSLSERYNTRMEDELRARLGVEFVERPAEGLDHRRPVREVAGVPAELIRAFSKRRHGIEQLYRQILADYRCDHGREPDEVTRRRLYQQATLAERPDKECGRPLRDMIDGWRAEANRVLGVDNAGEVVEGESCGRALRLDAVGSQQLEVMVAETLRIVQEFRSTWTEHHIRAEAQRQSRRLVVEDRETLVESIVEAASDPRRVLKLQPPRPVAEPEPLQRASGESVFVEHASARYTSTAMLDAEERIVDAARATSTHLALPANLDAQLAASRARGVTLTSEQANVARQFACSGAAVMLGLAPAGAGKTTAMRVTVDAWRASGRRVIALASSAVAADVLAGDLGVAGDTLAKFDHDDQPISRGTLIVVDEAGMAGTMMLDRLISRARSADAVVRLIGDDQQLAAIEAGGVIRQIAHAVGAVRMNSVVRFHDPAEAAASLAVRDGDVAAVNFYIDHGRISAGEAEEMVTDAYGSWLADIEAGHNTMLIASSGDEVTQLNARARADLVAAGLVGVDGVQLRDGTAAAAGDFIATRQNNRRLSVNRGRDYVKNGDAWQVVAVHGDGALTVEHRSHSGHATLPAAYVREHVELDYARTVHRAQGLTVDRAHMLVDPTIAREAFYVGLSRARAGTRLYVAVYSQPDPAHVPDVAGNAREILESIISRTAAEESATTTLRTAIDSMRDLRRMAVEYEHALGMAAGDRYRIVADQIQAGITRDPAWPSVAARLHRAEGMGWPPETLLSRAASMRDFAGAQSDAQVMCWRIDKILDADTPLTRLRMSDSGVPGWLAAAPPPNLATPWNEYLPARYGEMRTRISILSEQAERNPSGWICHLPDGDRDGRTAALHQIVAYRSVYRVTSEDDPLGPEPTQPGRQRTAWLAASQAIDAYRSQPTDPASNAAQMMPKLETVRPTLHDDPPCRDDRGPTRHL